MEYQYTIHDYLSVEEKYLRGDARETPLAHSGGDSLSQ